MLKLFHDKYLYFSLIGGIIMRFLSTLFYMILITIGIIISINIFAFIMGFFIIQKEQKGKIVYLYMLLLIATLFLAALFALFFKYEYISKFFLILSMLFLLMLAIIVANNSLLNDSEEHNTHYTKSITNNNSKNGHSILYNTLAILGLLYLFHEVFDYDNYDNDNYHNFDDENFHDDHHYNDDYHDYNYDNDDNYDSDNSDNSDDNS